MRLLNTKTFKLHEFAPKEIPDYAILSHTWDDDEVLFGHFQDGSAHSREGWSKIKKCCIQAQRDEWEYLWVDTCCIDKSSSAELSEAINSMYQWYSDSAVCYAYLYDFGLPDHSRIDAARWWKRGWTLQELLAPTQVFFYDRYWSPLGTKYSLSNQIRRITGITEQDLVDPRRASVARKMSWASPRETSRVEDIAYSLMGLFDVNMPLIYGEGAKAFTRLQDAIISKTNDDSIFAWRQILGTGEIESMLASSPAAFHLSSRIVQGSTLSRMLPPKHCAITNAGLRMDVLMRPVKKRVNEYEAILDCSDIETEDLFLVVLSKSDRIYSRVSSKMFGKVERTFFEKSCLAGISDPASFTLETIYIRVAVHRPSVRFLSFGRCRLELRILGEIGWPSREHRMIKERDESPWQIQTEDWSPQRIRVVEDKQSIGFTWLPPSATSSHVQEAFMILIGMWGHFYDVKAVRLMDEKSVDNAVNDPTWCRWTDTKMSRDYDSVQLKNNILISVSLKRPAWRLFETMVVEIAHRRIYPMEKIGQLL